MQRSVCVITYIPNCLATYMARRRLIGMRRGSRIIPESLSYLRVVTYESLLFATVPNSRINSTNNQGTILQINYYNSVLLSITVMKSYTLYILEWHLLAAPREYVRDVLVLRLDWTSYWFSSTCIFFVCLGPPSILLFFWKIHISHVHPPLPTGQLGTSTQVNNMAMLHHIYTVTHIYVHHIFIIIHSFLHTSSTPLGRPAVPDPSCSEKLWLLSAR